jgi:hypothetical protein
VTGAPVMGQRDAVFVVAAVALIGASLGAAAWAG